MEKQISELVDEYTILLIKKEKGLPILDSQLKEYEKLIPKELHVGFFGLKEVNLGIWEKFDEMREAENLEKIGRISIELEALNVMRNRITNKITEQYGGYHEFKKY